MDTLTEDHVSKMMLEHFPQFYIPKFELENGMLTRLTQRINESDNPMAVMTKFQEGRRIRRVVCAANRIIHDSFVGGELIVCAARHHNPLMNKVYRELGAQIGGSRGISVRTQVQGFIDQWEEFMTREEAYKVATIAGQFIDPERNHSDHELFSEGLY